MKNTILYTIIILIFSSNLQSQDVHFSHIHSSPTLLNPAMTGLFNGKIRMSGNYKSQWNNFTEGYSTAAAAFDVRAVEFKNNIIGAGISMYSDKAGDLDFSTNTVSMNASFIQLLGKDTWASVGFKNSFIQSRVDFTKAKTFEAEPVFFSNISYWDLSTGLAIMHKYKNGNLIYGGASLFHVNGANVSFLSKPLKGGPDQPNIETQDKKVVLHGGADIKVNRNLTLKPTFILMDQGPHREIMIGSFVKYESNQNSMLSEKNASISFGAWMRWYSEINLAGADALITSVRMDMNGMFVTLSYDANISSLRVASQGQGGVELSVVKVISHKTIQKRKISCPVNYF